MSTAEKEVARYNWLTTGDVADRCGVSDETVRGWIHQEVNGLRAMNIGTKKRPEYRVRPEWLADFEVRRTRNA